MAQTIEDVNSRTILQQFHELYKKQNENETNVQKLDTKIDQETINRQTADLSINTKIQALKDQIDSLGVLFTYKGEVATIQDLPAINNKPGDVYYVDNEQSEYVWLEKSGVYQWEEFGPAIDLSEYAKQEDLQQLENAVNAMNTKVESNTSNITSLTNTKQDKLTAGTNITIDENNVISANVISANDKLYIHNIRWNDGLGVFVYFIIINKSNSPITATALNDYLKTYGKITVNYLQKGTFFVEDDTIQEYLWIEASTISSYPQLYYARMTAKYNNSEITFISDYGTSGTSSSEFTDTVTEM